MLSILLIGIPASAEAVKPIAAAVTADCAAPDTNPNQRERHWHGKSTQDSSIAQVICFYGQGRWTQTMNCQVPLSTQNAPLWKEKEKQFREKKRMEISIIQQHWQKTNPGSSHLCNALFVPTLVAAPVRIRSTTNCLFLWTQQALIASDHADRAYCLIWMATVNSRNSHTWTHTKLFL